MKLSAFIESLQLLSNNPYGKFYFDLTFTCSNQSPDGKHNNKEWELKGVFRTLSTINMKFFPKILNVPQLLTIVFIVQTIKYRGVFRTQSNI